MGSRDWSDAPNDLLDSIAARLEVPDILYFGVVCRTWQAVQAGRRSPRMPWLILPVESYEYPTFLDPSTDDFHTVAMPDDSRSLFFEDSKDGWILARHYKCLFLLNPLKQTRISLPPLESFSISSERIGIIASFNRLRLCRAPADSSSSSSFTVAALSYKWIAILRREDMKWMVLIPDLNPCTSCEDLIQFEEEKIHALMDTGEVHAWDLSGVSPVRILQTACLSDESDEKDQNKFCKRLVDCAGDLLQVWRRRNSCEDGNVFRIFKLDRDGAFWTPTKTLNACSLFFGVGQCISLPASSVPSLRANLVYFTSKYVERNSETCIVGLLDLDDGSFDTIYTEVLEPPHRSGYVPNLWFALNPI